MQSTARGVSLAKALRLSTIVLALLSIGATLAQAAIVRKVPESGELVPPNASHHTFSFEVEWQGAEKTIEVMLGKDCDPGGPSFEIVKDEGKAWYARLSRPDGSGSLSVSTSLLTEETRYCFVYQESGSNEKRLAAPEPFQIAYLRDVAATKPLRSVVIERDVRTDDPRSATSPLAAEVKWRVKLGTVFIHVRDRRGREHDEKGTGIVVNRWGHVATSSHLLIDKEIEGVDVRFFPKAWPGEPQAVAYELAEVFSPGDLMLRGNDTFVRSGRGRLALLRPLDWSAVPHGKGSFPWALRIAANPRYPDSQQHLWIVGVTQEGREPLWQAAWVDPEIVEGTPIARLGEFSSADWQDYPRYVARVAEPGFSGAPVIDAKGRVWALEMGEVPELPGSPHVGTWAVDIVTFFDQMERDGRLDHLEP